MQPLYFESRPTISTGIRRLNGPPGHVCVDFHSLIWDYALDERERPAYLIMRDPGGVRQLSTQMDAWGWATLVAQTKQQKHRRPVTHEAWAATIKELGGDVQDVVVEKVNEADNWFETQLRIVHNRRLISMPIRASDGYVLATVFDVPIFAAEKLLVTSPSEI